MIERIVVVHMTAAVRHRIGAIIIIVVIMVMTGVMVAGELLVLRVMDMLELAV